MTFQKQPLAPRHLVFIESYPLCDDHMPAVQFRICLDWEKISLRVVSLSVQGIGEKNYNEKRESTDWGPIDHNNMKL